MNLPGILSRSVRNCAMMTIAWASCQYLPTAAYAESPASQIEEVMNGSDYKHAQWGVLAVDMETGAPVYEHDPDKLFAPASTTKLYSVAAALDGLGADHQFKTRVIRRGNIDDDGGLNGDLIL